MKLLFFVVYSIFSLCLSSSTSSVSAKSSTCQPTRAQETYTNATDYLLFTDPENHSSQYNLILKNGFYGGSFPDGIRFNGNGTVKLSDATGSVMVDADTKTGKYITQFWVDNIQPEEGVFLTGTLTFVSSDFDATPSGQYVPFQQSGIAKNLVQHGCSGQGEPSFPQLLSRISTWGHCDVYLNGTLLYPDLWLHTMLTNKYRDETTGAIYADKDHTEIYSPKRCWEGDVNPNITVNALSIDIIVARWCYDPDWHTHPQTDVVFVLAFDVEELAPEVVKQQEDKLLSTLNMKQYSSHL